LGIDLSRDAAITTEDHPHGDSLRHASFFIELPLCAVQQNAKFARLMHFATAFSTNRAGQPP